MYDRLSARISARYARIENFSQRKRRKPNKATIYSVCSSEEEADISDFTHSEPLHLHALIIGAPIKWVYGKPCWNHPSFPKKPFLHHYISPDTGDYIFILPSYPK